MGHGALVQAFTPAVPFSIPPVSRNNGVGRDPQRHYGPGGQACKSPSTAAVRLHLVPSFGVLGTQIQNEPVEKTPTGYHGQISRRGSFSDASVGVSSVLEIRY